LIVGLTACVAAREAATEEPSAPIYAITSVTVIDVEKGVAVPDQTVIIVGDHIEQVGTQEETHIPEMAQIVDGTRLYLIPGLVDAHVHYYDAPVFGRLMIANGVLFVRDMGMPNEYILGLRDELNQGKTLGPEMVAAGVILDGYSPIIPSISVGLLTPEDGRVAVRKQAEAGADMIKTYSRLDRDVFLAILAEAQKYNLKVVAHLPESVYLEDAAAAGLASSEHFNGFEKVIANLLGEPVDLNFHGQAASAGYLARLDEVNLQDLQAVYRRLYESGLTICPTVVTFKTLTNVQAILKNGTTGNEYISESVADMWESLWASQEDLPEFIWQNWVRMVKGLNQAGVPLLVGTDLILPGIIPGYSVHEEMVIWQEAGIPTADVLRSATIVPAQFMGVDDRLGSLQAGKTVSLVLVRGNPLEDIRNAQQIEGVFLRGQYFSRGDLDHLLQEAQELARQPAQP
jgi:imidazolonepropionase-like amidohydrolase